MKKLLVLFCLFLAACVSNVSAAAPTPTPLSLRIPPYTGCEYLVTDATEDKESHRQMDLIAQWAKIDPPYQWDVYNIDGAGYKQINFYYTNILRDKGYAVVWNNYLDNIGATTYEHEGNRIYLQVKDPVDKHPTLVTVFYKSS